MKLHVWSLYVCSNCRMSSSVCLSTLIAICPCLRCALHSLANVILLTSFAMYDETEVVVVRQQACRDIAMWTAYCKGQPPEAFVYVCRSVPVHGTLLEKRATATALLCSTGCTVVSSLLSLLYLCQRMWCVYTLFWFYISPIVRQLCTQAMCVYSSFDTILTIPTLL